MDLFDQAELVINRAAAENLIAQLVPELHRAGWTVECSTDDTPTLWASKGTGRLCVPGGRNTRWDTQVAEADMGVSSTEARSDLLPEFDEVLVWRAALHQSTPADLVLSIAERAADGPSSVLV